MKKIIITFLITLLIIISVVYVKNEYSCEIPIGNRGIKAATLSGDLKALFIGSSTFRSNIDMPTADEAFDSKVYTIAYGGNQLVACDIQYDEIEKRSTSKYDLMIFELDPLMLTEAVKLSDSRVIWDLSFEGKKALWEKMLKSGNTNLSIMFEYFVTSGMDDLLTYPVTEKFYSTRYYKGAKTDETPSSGKEYLENEEFDISDSVLIHSQEDALISIIKKCQNDGQNFIFLESPRYHRLQNDETYNKFKGQMLEILDENNVEYILAEDVDFDNTNADYFEDMGHMSQEGRREYTKALLSLDIFS